MVRSSGRRIAPSGRRNGKNFFGKDGGEAEEKKRWANSWSTYLTYGMVEYLDAFEQEFIELAQSMWDLEAKRNELRAVDTQLKEAQARLARPTGDAVTDDDAKGAVEQAQDALNSLLRRKPYTHCELDPSAILGISASIIPMPEKNQAPRNVYQCLGSEETVVMSDGSLKQMKDIRNGDSVMTVNPVTLEQSPSKIYNHFIKWSEDYGKKMYKLTTLDGKSVVATEDHHFLTGNGWKEVKDLAVNKDHLIFCLNKDETLYIKIKSIEEQPPCMIGDFTTESPNHSFLLGNMLVSSNCSMGKQALGIYHSNYLNRFDTTVKTLAFPSRPLFETQMNQVLGLDVLPAGQMVKVAIMTYTDSIKKMPSSSRGVPLNSDCSPISSILLIKLS